MFVRQRKIWSLACVGLYMMLTWFACSGPLKHTDTLNDAGNITVIPGKPNPRVPPTGFDNQLPDASPQESSAPEQASTDQGRVSPPDTSSLPDAGAPSPDRHEPTPERTIERPNDNPEQPDLSDTGNKQRWIGEPCSQDSDCNYNGGFCQTDASGYPQGHCSLACTRSCPDKAGKPVTFCITNANGGGHCVSRCSSAHFPQGGCRTAYACRNRSRYNEASTTQDVCVPAASNPPNQDKGTYVAQMYITYYYLSREADYTGTADTALYDKNCKEIVRVSAKFSDSVCIEGSGILKDGRVINYAKGCSCGRRCPTGGIVCYSVLDKTRYPWGAGAASRSLRPLRSLAVDRSKIAIGTRLYIPEWDGVKIPAVDGIGGFTHDGCVVADDVGGAIKGNHFDFFSGTRTMWKALEAIHPTKKYLTVYKDPGRCP